MKNNRILRAALTLLITTVLLLPGTARAEKEIEIQQPKAVKSSQLPAPGVSMILKFELTNTRELDRAVKAMIVRDGRLLEVPLFKSYLNEKDRPTYEFQVNAPLAELNYQFVAYEGNDKTIVSDRYWVRRDCLPSIELTQLQIDSTLPPGEQLKELFAKSVSIGDEIEQYEHVLRQIESLQKLLKE